MKAKFIVLVSLSFSICSMAARLDDVSVLDVSPGPEIVRLKMQDQAGSSNSFFFVDILKSDPQSFDKLSLVLQKLKMKNQMSLSLEIKSFSDSPNGSSYAGQRVQFFENTDRTPNSVTDKKKKKK